MDEPVRFQLRRAKGFDLQAISRARNGLPAARYDQPGRLGDPWFVQDASNSHDCVIGIAHDRAVARFRAWIGPPNDGPKLDEASAFVGTRDCHARLLAGLPELRGKILACSSRPDSACHADVLLIVANCPRCDAPAGPA